MTDRTTARLKLLSLLTLISCGYYFIGYLSDPAELLNFNETNRTEPMMRFVFLLATLFAILSAPGLYLLQEWAAWPALAGGALLSLPLAFVIAESFSSSTISELPFSFFSLSFWLMLYSVDLLGPVLLAFLTRPSVRVLLH